MSPVVANIDTWSSTSAIARAFGAGPGQDQARTIQESVVNLLRQGRSSDIAWVKWHAGMLGNERAYALAGGAAEKSKWLPVTSLVHLRLWISERFRTAADAWHGNPAHHGTRKYPHRRPRNLALTRRETRWPGRQSKFAWAIGGRWSTWRGSRSDKITSASFSRATTGCLDLAFCSIVLTSSLGPPECRLGKGKTREVPESCWPALDGRDVSLSFWSYRGSGE